MRQALDDAGLTGAVKTSGAKGVHVFVPVEPGRSIEDVAAATRALAARAERIDPVLATTAFIRDDREGKVFLDSTRAGGATVVAAYSPRVRPGAPVSFPVSWDDLDSVSPADFTVRTAAALLADRDPWVDLMPAPQRLPEDLVAEGHTIPVARVAAMHEGKTPGTGETGLMVGKHDEAGGRFASGHPASPARQDPVEVEVGDRTVRISSPDRVYFPATGATKLDLVNYYLSVGDGIVRALRERPCMLHRFPSGVAGEKVHQKRVPAGAPPWLETVRVHFPRYNRLRGRVVRHRAGQRDLGGPDVHSGVSPVELAGRGHRTARRVAYRPGPDAGLPVRHGAQGRARGARDSRRAGRRRLAEDLRRPRHARLRANPAALGVRRGAQGGAGVREGSGAARSRTT